MTTSLVSIKGQRTSNNQDVLVQALNKNAMLYMLVDGSSSRAQSGELAQLLASIIKQGFEALIPEQLDFPNIKISMVNLLKSAQQQARTLYPAAVVSFNAVVVIDSIALSLYLGDCLLATVNRWNKIYWKTQPHCVQNNQKISQLALLPERNLLTRSFKARRFEVPQFQVFALKQTQKLLLASDGFWADLSPSQQAEFIKTKHLHEAPSDDTSFILIGR